MRVRVTRFRKTRHLAVMRPSDDRYGLRTRLTASEQGRTLRSVGTRWAAEGLVFVTVTEGSTR